MNQFIDICANSTEPKMCNVWFQWPAKG